MTSPLRKKPPITVPNIQAATAPDQRRRPWRVCRGPAVAAKGLLSLFQLSLLASALMAQTAATERAPSERATNTDRRRSTLANTEDWTTPRYLPNSKDQLNWQPPKAPPLPKIHRSQPSFLQTFQTLSATAPVQLTPADVAVHKTATPAPAATSASPPNVAAKVQPPALPVNVARGARRLQPLRHARSVRLVAAQQPEVDAQPSDVFDDVLDELLPGDTARGPTEFPDLEDSATDTLEGDTPSRPAVDLPGSPSRSDAELQDTFGDDLDALDFDSTIDREPTSAGPGDEAADVFGDQPDSLPVPQPTRTAPRESTSPGLPEATQRPLDSPRDSRPEFGPAEEMFEEPAAVDPGAESEPMDRMVPPRDVPPGEANPLRAPRLGPDTGLPPRVPGDELMDYNGRNCPEELADLQAAWDQLRGTPIASITLDITPSVERNELLEQTEDMPPREAVVNSPSRIWHDREGQQIAEGKLEDFRNGRILIRQPDGTPRWLSWYDLGNAELCFVSAWWGIPSEYSPESQPYEPRDWTMTTFTWAASALCHKPLYFEEVQLERYGHTAGPMKQAVLSGAHFFGNIFFLPYHVGLNLPNECQYTLGYYRPGDCAPWMIPAVPLSSRAFRYQMGAVVSGLTLLP